MSFFMSFRKNNNLTNFNLMKYSLIILFILSGFNFSQDLKYKTEYGNFTSASSFDVDLNKNIYVSDIAENTITKLDSSGNEIISIGGYGWQESAFDEPVSMFTNTLSVYVADKNNARIQRFDKDLNFLSQYRGNNNNKGLEFAYPTCIAISNIGDLFLLDSDNNRILKFNLNGEYLLEIGGNDAGSYALSNPIDFSTDLEGNIFVLDNNTIKVFDLYGNGQFLYSLKFEPNKIHVFEKNILYIEDSKIVLYNLQDRKIRAEYKNFPNLNKEIIVDTDIIDNTLLILTPKRIIKYQIMY